MTKVLDVIYDGGLRSFFEKYKGTTTGPEDWSEELDHYIHGTPKRSEPIQCND